MKEAQLRSLLLMAAAALLAGGCAATRPPAKVPEPLPIPSADNYMASIEVADITPPLHLSLFGYGPESRIATGVRLRLRCEIFVIATSGRAVALVPCDLNSPSLALQRAVAAQLAQKGVPIGAGALFIMATHTHAGPAHYYESRRYSGTLSSSAPGYDPRVVEFLATRIASKIAAAYGSLEPVCLGWRSRDLEGLSFNRSFLPFLANKRDLRADHPDIVVRALQAEAALRHNMVPAADEQNAARRELRASVGALAPSGPETAIDPQLSVLRITRLRGANSCQDAKLIGVFAVYGMHPTGVPNTNELYHGDIFGFAMRAAEGLLSGARDNVASNLSDAWKAESAPPVDEREHVIVGLANGVEGDVSPKLAPQSVVSARKHGFLLGAAIADLADLPERTQEEAPFAKASTRGKLTVVDARASGTIDVASKDLRFPSAEVSGNRHLCKFAELGVAAGGGAQDGPTRLRILPEANAGYRLVHGYGCHAEKLPLRTGAHDPHDFPEVAPIGLVRVAGGLIATAPGEMTTVTGQRIRFAISDALGKQEVLALVGLTNQYLQYFTTAEEYKLQYYEGASNLYGPNTQEFLSNQFAMLAKLLGSSSPIGQIQLEPFDPDPSPRVIRWPAPSEPKDASSLGELKLHPVERTDSDGLALYIDELPLDFLSDRDRFAVQVLMQRADGEFVVVDDDRGSSIEVSEVDGKWRIRWLPDTLPRTPARIGATNATPPPDPRCGKQFKLAVQGRIELVSQAKELKCAPR